MSAARALACGVRSWARRFLVVGWITVSVSSGCDDDNTFFECPQISYLLGRCRSGDLDWLREEDHDRPVSCVNGNWQYVGLGRCETDADCAPFTGTDFIPVGADPPYSRCIEFAAWGERFCEGFTGPGARIVGQCEPGWPCGTWANDYPNLQRCVSQQTRTAGAPAFIIACVPGAPTDLVDPRCGEPRYP